VAPRRTAKDRLRLLELAEDLGNVTKACRATRFSRDSYYRFKQLGKARLELRSAGRRVAPEAEALVRTMTDRHPEWGKYRMAKNVSEALSPVRISPNGVRALWRRDGRATPRVRFLRPSKRR
jgi:hypothetical protein